MTVKWYQNVEGVDGAVFKDPRRANSIFWGEGKWKNFILPLLPLERRTFVEIGCSAGLFLKLAMDAGFTNVIGIDADPDSLFLISETLFDFSLVAVDGIDKILRGTLIAPIPMASAVPVPASVWLFGSGLLGLIGIARRKKAA